MKIMSFNTQHCLNYIEQKIDFAIMAKAIKACDPDIVGLQEMRGEGPSPEYTDQVRILSELTGMQYYYFAHAIDIGGEGLYGNGLLSKRPIVRAEKIMIPDPVVKVGRRYETRCIIKAELEGGVTVLTTHFGLNHDEQVNAVATVVKNLADQRCILMGDFNVTPDDAVLSEIRAKMKDTADAIDGEQLTFPSDVPQRKIDYIFVSPDVKVCDAEIPAIVASDHRPHLASVEL